MKTLIAGVVASLLLSLPATAHAQKMKLGQVLILHAPDLKPDADTNAFERVVLRRLAPVWKQRAPGIELHLVQKNRGNVKGRYLLAYSIDTLAHAKDYISAASESSPFTGALLAKIGEVRRELPPFTISEGQYVEYRLVGKDNTASGAEALFSNTNGAANTASGVFALQFNTTGFDNTAIGSNAGVPAGVGDLTNATDIRRKGHSECQQQDTIG